VYNPSQKLNLTNDPFFQHDTRITTSSEVELGLIKAIAVVARPEREKGLVSIVCSYSVESTLCLLAQCGFGVACAVSSL